MEQVKLIRAFGILNRTFLSYISKSLTSKNLSDAGKELYQYMQGLNEEWINHVMGELNQEDIKGFIRTIDYMSKRAKEFHH